MTREKFLSIVIVAYNDAEGLAKCLDSLSQFETADSIEVVVVDNSTTGDVLAMMRRAYPETTYLPNKNTGYGAGNNLGFSRTSGEILLFLNPDTYLVQRVSSEILDIFDRKSTVGALGIRIIDQHAAKTQSFFWVDNGGIVKSLFQQALSRAGVFIPSRMCTSGAALFVRRAAFVAAGGFDEKMFMYCEEPDLWRRITALGWSWDYVADLRIAHLGGGTITEGTFAVRQRLISLRHYCNKYGIDFGKQLRKELRYLRLSAGAKRLLHPRKNAVHARAVARLYVAELTRTSTTQ